MLYSELNKAEKESVIETILQLRKHWISIRWIVIILQEDHNVTIWKTTVWEIVSKKEIEEIEEDVWEKEVEFDEQNLYVYTSSVNQYWEKIVARHSVPFDLVNRIQKAYVRKGKNWTWDQILTFNWWTEENPILLKPKVWDAIKSATWLQKTCGIANEIFLKILYDKFGKAEVEGYLEELAYDTTRERFRELEETHMTRAKEKQFEDVLRRDAKLEVYLEKIGEFVRKYTPKNLLTPTKHAIRYDNHLMVAFGDLHCGRTTHRLQENLNQMLQYLLESPYENISLINVWDNLETPLLQGMHVSQILDMDHRGFDQMLKCAELLESLLSSLHNAWKKVQMFGIVWNHDRNSKQTDDDPERLPWLAVYEIVKARLHWAVPVTYFKNNVNTFVCWDFNVILSHWDNWFANKSPEQIANLKWSPFHYSLIISWHLHTPKIEQGSGRTRIQTPSMNNQDRYADTIIMKESLPWFVTIETVNKLPKVTFHNCMSD